MRTHFSLWGLGYSITCKLHERWRLSTPTCGVESGFGKIRSPPTFETLGPLPAVDPFLEADGDFLPTDDDFLS